MKLYKCPNCGRGKKAPDKLDPEDSRLFCFSCSDKTGKLVRRIVPAIVQAKVERAKKRAEKAEARREAEARAEWERLHTWPGVREVRWKKWSTRVKTRTGKMPVVRGATTIGEHYSEIVRLATPTLPDTGDTSKAIRFRGAFLRRIGLPDVLVNDLLYRDDRGPTWAKAYAWIHEHAVDWLIEDLGITDAEAVSAIRGVAERADVSNPEDVKSLNNVITNAFALAQKKDQNPDDLFIDNNYKPSLDVVEFLADHEPIGGWQGAR